MRLRPEPPRVTTVTQVLAGLGLQQRAWASVARWSMQLRPETAAIGQELIPPTTARRLTDWRVCRRTIPACPNSAHRSPEISAARSSTCRTAGRPFRHQEVLLPRQPAPARRSNVGRRNWRRLAPRAVRVHGTRPANTATAAQPSTAVPRQPIASLGLAPRPATPSAQDRQLAFLSPVADKRTVSPDRVAAPASGNVLQAGAVISAALITGIAPIFPDHRAGDGKRL